MRISDWSSDVCSSDLKHYWRQHMKAFHCLAIAALSVAMSTAHADTFRLRMGGGHTTGLTYVKVYDTFFADEVSKRVSERTDRKSVVKGKGVSVRVDLGGRRIIKNKKSNNILNT